MVSLRSFLLLAVLALVVCVSVEARIGDQGRLEAHLSQAPAAAAAAAPAPPKPAAPAAAKPAAPAKPHYNVRESQVNPDGSKKNSGRFAKKPVAPPAPVYSPWSAAIMAARAGDVATLQNAKTPVGPYTKPSDAYLGANKGGPAGWCGSLINGWLVPGKCYNGGVCQVGTPRPDGSRSYFCRDAGSSSYTKNEDPLPLPNLPTPAPKVVSAPVARCGPGPGSCQGNRDGPCCKGYGPGASGSYYCGTC